MPSQCHPAVVSNDSVSNSLPSLISTLQSSREDKELHWLVSSVIMPEFERILETLQICGNMLLYNSPQHPDPEKHIERGPSIKLPVSSNKLEALKGIIVRNGIYITQLSLNLKDSYFNKHIHRINLNQPVLLPQLITAKESIDSAMLLIRNFNEDQNHSDLKRSFENILHELSIAKQCLQFPIDPKLVFPIHIIESEWFTPPLPLNLSLDIYINQAELCIDMKNLHKITEEPWSHIDPELGKSYVDKVRDEMRNPTNGTTTPLNLSDVHLKEEESAPHHLALKALGQLLKPKMTPQEYITKCVTYNNSVVMVNRKIDVSCPDPLLVSTYTKLDSLENIVESFLHNLKVACAHD